MLLLISSIIVTFIIAEIIIRIIGTSETTSLENTTIDGYTIRKPELIANYKLNQYNNELHFNEVGFRDDSWQVNTEKIAVIGDSFMEALCIPEDNYFASILQRITKHEVINISREKFNTIEEVYFFKKFAVHLKPKLVLLFMYMNNDISFNSEYKTKYKGKNTSPINYINKNGIYTLPSQKFSSNILSSIKTFIINHSIIIPKLYHSILKISYGRFSNSEKPEFVFGGNQLDEIYIIDKYQSKKNIADWKATEDALLEIKKIVNQYGGEFVLITFESRYTLPKSRFLDKEYPLQKISTIATENELIHFSLNTFLDDYYSKIKGPKEGLHLSDGHWNMLSHHIITYYVLQRLIDNGIILLNKEVTNELKGLLHKNPVDIIGKDEYSKIYGNN
jgi:hypothetical protein